MLRPSIVRRVVIASICSILTLSASDRSASAQTNEPRLPLRLTAFAVNMSGVGQATSGTVDITVERWSTDGERDRLLDVLVQKGSERLLSTLQGIRPRAGFINAPGSLSWDIYFARWEPGEDGGYRVIFATDRPISFWEARANPRSRDYEFMLCEIHLGSSGVGEGKLATLAKVSYDKKAKRIEVENYGNEPVRLTEVRVRGRD